jgi:hypothetical protein
MQPQDPPVSVQPLVAGGAQDPHQIMAAQDHIIGLQDQQLGSISQSLGGLKNMGLQIRDELDMQVRDARHRAAARTGCDRSAARDSQAFHASPPRAPRPFAESPARRH